MATSTTTPGNFTQAKRSNSNNNIYHHSPSASIPQFSYKSTRKTSPRASFGIQNNSNVHDFETYSNDEFTSRLEQLFFHLESDRILLNTNNSIPREICLKAIRKELVFSSEEEISKSIRRLNEIAMKSLHPSPAACLEILSFCEQFLATAKQLPSAPFTNDLNALTFNSLSCYYRYHHNTGKSLQLLDKALALKTKSSFKGVTLLNKAAVLSSIGRHSEALSNAKEAAYDRKRALQEYVQQSHQNSANIEVSDYEESQKKQPQSSEPKSQQQIQELAAELAIALHNVAIEEEYLHIDARSQEHFKEAAQIVSTYLDASHPLAIRFDSSNQQLNTHNNPRNSNNLKSQAGSQRTPTIIQMKKNANLNQQEFNSTTGNKQKSQKTMGFYIHVESSEDLDDNVSKEVQKNNNNQMEYFMPKRSLQQLSSARKKDGQIQNVLMNSTGTSRFSTNASLSIGVKNSSTVAHPRATFFGKPKQEQGLIFNPNGSNASREDTMTSNDDTMASRPTTIGASTQGGVNRSNRVTLNQRRPNLSQSSLKFSGNSSQKQPVNQININEIGAVKSARNVFSPELASLPFSEQLKKIKESLLQINPVGSLGDQPTEQLLVTHKKPTQINNFSNKAAGQQSSKPLGITHQRQMEPQFRVALKPMKSQQMQMQNDSQNKREVNTDKQQQMKVEGKTKNDQDLYHMNQSHEAEEDVEYIDLLTDRNVH